MDSLENRNREAGERGARISSGGSAPDRTAPDRTLEIPMRLLGRTVKQTRSALASMAPGQVLAVRTDDP